MAATGGGKIRTRRYHIVSKPYAKGKQQPGLITRVTDTVKSIVPSWLQKYFKNGELTETGEARVEVEQNNVSPSPNGNEENALLRDGRNSPEPSTSNAEPSTSRASLNFQDILSRPPLNRSHLHFPSLDGSPALGPSNSLFSQPSTSTAPFPASPFAVASSFSLVKEIKDSCSQHEDDNISTTSGFSSRASDKDVPTSKNAPLLWSPETERTHSGLLTSQTSLKKPSFNLSVFGTSTSSAINSSVLNSSQLGDSPFYPGKTTYGGAAAARTARARPGTPYQAPVRRQIKAKPAGAQPCGVTSATARRILQSLERMSSPLADAKRIPSAVSSPLSTSLNHSDLDVSHYQTKKKKLEPAVPPVQKLVIPAAAAVTGNRSMSFRPSLTPGSVRGAEKRNKEMPVRKSPLTPDAVSAPPPSTSSLSYPLSSTPTTSNSGTGGGKMKRERSVRPSAKRPDDEAVELPNLPAISLPISTFTLPTFSFSSPTPTSTPTPARPSASVTEEPAVSKASTVSTPPVVPFIFSSPIVKATAASPPPPFSPSSGFTFSVPTMKTVPSASNGKPVPATTAVKVAANEGKEEYEGPFKPAKTLKQGSVLDILKGPGFASPVQSSSASAKELRPASESTSSTFGSGFGEKFKPAPGSWNCESCLLQNKPSDKKCVACQAPQPIAESSSKLDSKPAKTSAASLSKMFAPPPGSWECDTCLVQNKSDVVKCVACDTAKPGTGVKPTLTLPPVSAISSTICAPSSSATTTTATSTASGLVGFGDKFKKPEGAWDCDVCMVQNKAQDVKCVACQSAKPGTGAAASVSSSLTPAPKTSTAPLLGFGDKFKKPEGSWDCDVCCVQNKAEDQQCVACQSAKPGAKIESKGFSSSFGTPSSSTESNSTSFKFGTGSSNTASVGLNFGGTNSSNSMGFQMGNTSSDSNSKSAGFKFGASSSDNSAGFKFGASTESASTATSSSGGFKFDGSSDGFKFGTSVPLSTTEEKKNESQNSSSNFKIGVGSAVTAAGSTSTTTVSGGFSFGQSKTEEKEFSFSAPKAKTVKTNAPSSSESTSAASTTVSSTIPIFGKPPVTEPATAVPSFGQPAAKEPALTTSTFSFGKPEEKKDASVPTSGLAFNTAKETDKSAPSLGFSFSKPELPKELPKPTFTFGKPAEPTETSKPAFGFGQNSTDAAATKPAFNFMANSTSTPASSNPAQSIFGTPSSTSLAPTPASTSTFIFGQGASSDGPPAKTFLFGQQQQDSQPASTAPLAAPAPAQPFLFGSTNNSGSFSFGAASATTPASAAPAPQAAPSPFVFSSATSSSGFGSGQTPSFGQGSSQTSTPAFGSPAPSFSSTASPASSFVFGQQSNSTAVFGSSTASAGQGGFQFGAPSAFGTPSRGSGVFTFGGGPGTAGNSASSPAMAAQPGAPGGGFNFSQSPSFNIGSAKNATSATPAGNIAGRKIKTAVRRRK